jgi:BlaI family transcriptional regulator, penicillinase repressor
MSKSKRYRLGELQLHIMRVLWERGSASVADVQEALAQRELAYTTVATMLRKMEERGLVKHKTEGRSFLYRAAVPPEAVSRSMAGDLLENLFAGSLADMMSHLLSTRDVSRDELARLERLIAERKKQT